MGKLLEKGALMAESSLSVSAGGRLHFGLLDMAGVTDRSFGGIGCVLEEPRVVVSAQLSSSGKCTFSDHSGFLKESSAEHRVLSRFVEVEGLYPVDVRVDRSIPAHIGLGSRTATILSGLTAAFLVNGRTVTERDKLRIAATSGRGGTSGIGVHGFFSGGWVVDCGRPRGVPFLPSSAQIGNEPSLLSLVIGDTGWKVGLFLASGSKVFGQVESTFFSENTPVPEREVLSSMGDLYHGMVPALLECNMQLFGRALERYQSKGFKRVEIARQSTSVRDLLASLREVSACVGMSSMGPMVFAFGEDSDSWARIAEMHECQLNYTTVARSGWRVEWPN